jgi:hypothetical protein
MVTYSKLRAAAVGDDGNVTTHDFVIEDEVFPDAGTAGLTHNLATMEGDFITFFNGLVNDLIVGAGTKPTAFRWYRADSGNLPWGDPARVLTNPVTLTGSGNVCPPQVACTVTEKTDSRRHWGRFYIPGIRVSMLNADGSLATNGATGIADRAQTLYNAWNTRGVQPIVLGSVKPGGTLLNAMPLGGLIGSAFERSIGKDTTDDRIRITLPVTGLRVDDILDVQRSRRFETPIVRLDRTLV